MLSCVAYVQAQGKWEKVFNPLCKSPADTIFKTSTAYFQIDPQVLAFYL